MRSELYFVTRGEEEEFELNDVLMIESAHNLKFAILGKEVETIGVEGRWENDCDYLKSFVL